MDIITKTNVFSPIAVQGKGKRGTLTPLALVDKVVVPHLPQGAADETKRALLFLLMCAGTSERRSLNEWKAYVATYVAAIAPSLVQRFPANVFTLAPLSDTQVAGITSAFQRLKTSLEARDTAQVQAVIAELGAASVIPGLPVLNPSLEWTTASKQWAVKILMGHFSIVLFMTGKRVEGDDHTSIAIARPDAIKKKAHLSMPVAFWDGDLKLSDTSHLFINNAWAEMSALRSLVLTEFSKYAQSDTDFSQDIIYTTMHLLQWSNMQHARITMDFIRAFPWVATIPALRTPLSVYVSSVRALEKVDPNLRPYVKLIYGDKSGVFPRKDLEPLVACAVSVASEVSTSLKDFYVSNAYVPIVDAFNEERERRDTIRLGEIAKRERELGLTEEEAGLWEDEEATEAPTLVEMEE